MLELKNIEGETLYRGNFKNIKDLLEAAIKEGVDLREVDLRWANLEGVNLRGVDLRGADLEGADLEGVNLRGANLEGVNLRGANLRGAILEGASLRWSNLEGADLRGANLEGADLEGADLEGVNLRGANLRGVNLRGCAGNRLQIRSLFVSEVYPITYTSKYLQIGCEQHLIKDWWNFDDKRIEQMDGHAALAFWSYNKEFIKSAIENYPATK